ncbi:hypothetical protein ACHAXM_000243 [Skeletonema potamos]
MMNNSFKTSVSFNDFPEVVVYEVDDPPADNNETPSTAATTKKRQLLVGGILVSLLIILAIVGGVVATTHNDDVPSVAVTSTKSQTTTPLPSPGVRSMTSISTPPPLTPAPRTCSQSETTCRDDNGNVSSCASDGDCPCFNNKQKCRSRRFGSYCDVVCCEPGVEERCQDDATNIVSCMKISDGGRPCSKDSEVKCPSSGECATLCCDDDHQTCYDRDTGDPTHCALISSGGCPCPDGKEKCGATVSWAGYCVPIGTCCAAGEVSCHDMDGNKSCKQLSEGGCPQNMSYEYWEAMIPGTLITKGSPREVKYFYDIRKRMEERDDDKDQLAMLRGEEAELFQTVRLRERNVFGKETKKIIA